jgi:glycerol uptake facilitator-like aquaporin
MEERSARFTAIEVIVAGDLTSVWLYVLGPLIGGVLGALLYERTMAQTEGPG